MQDRDPGPAKILHRPEKLKVTLRKCRSRMKRPVAEHGSKTQEEEHTEYVLKCLKTVWNF